MAPPIAIVGAGPCGLTLARLLERNNIDYVVYERDSSDTPAQQLKAGIGGSLDLHQTSGLEALRRAGLYEEFNKFARWDAMKVTMADNYQVKLSTGGEERIAPEIDRTQLRQLLLDSVPANKIHWSHAVKTIEKDENGSGWVIKFTNGTSASGFGLIAGTDGAWSKIRSLFTNSKPIYSGKHFIEARLSKDNPSHARASALAGPGMFLSMGFNRAVIIQQMADGSYRIYLGLQLPEDFSRSTDFTSNAESLRNSFLTSSEYFVNWSPEVKQIIKDAELPFRPWPLYSLPVEAIGWPRVPGVTLLGDAAHLSVPNGEGVNSAMYDSLVLADRISAQYNGEDISSEDISERLERAVTEYEEDMFPRAKEHIKDGDALLSRVFAEGAIDKFLQVFESSGGD